MNKYIKEFFHRGLMFSGFGPIVFSIIVLCISSSQNGVAFGAKEILTGIISTYLIAFVQAGATVFNQIEHWSVPRSLLFHFGSLYIVYSLCYILNSWIPFKLEVLAVFTAIFVAVYFAVWTTVYLCVRKTGKQFNEKLKN